MDLSPVSSESSQPLYHTNECSICIDNFEEDNQCLLLKCGHIFHKTCLKSWEETAHNAWCPVCRKSFVIISTVSEELPQAARKSAVVTAKLFYFFGLPFAGIAGAVGLGYMLKNIPALIASMRHHLNVHNHLESELDHGSRFSTSFADAVIRFLADFGDYLTSGTDPKILENNPPLIDVSDPKDFAAFLLILGAIAITVTTTGFLIMHCTYQYSMRHRAARHIRYSGAGE